MTTPEVAGAPWRAGNDPQMEGLDVKGSISVEWQSAGRLLGMFLAALLSACGGSSGSGPSPSPTITVTIAPQSMTVQAGDTVRLDATVQNDISQLGVTWAISPPSDAGALSDTDAYSVLYSAPAGPPAGGITATITATSRDDTSKSDSVNITVSPLVIVIEPAGATVEAGESLALTANVQHDPSQAGVTWTISPESGAGSLLDVTHTSVTYEAPSSPPPSDVNVAITATSITDEAVSTSAIILVPAIAVQLTPDSALMPVNATQPFAASVIHDPDNLGASWTLTQGSGPCSPACGSLGGVDPTSATFKAPPEVPTNATVTLMATSVADPGQIAFANLELSTGTVQLAPAALDFGLVKSKRAKRTTLTNAGSTALAFSGVVINGKDADQFSVRHDCDVSITAGGSCNIDVTFSPKNLGLKEAVLSIADSSTDSPQQVPLSGFGGIYASIAALKSALQEGNTLATPTPTGPLDVGTRTIDLIDSARDDSYLADGRKRELLVRFWYPASASNGCKPAPYAMPAVWKYQSELIGQSLPVVKTHSCLDASHLEGAYPVVVFTHGYTGTFTDYTYLFEDLASRGYTVASVAHTYESTAVSFPDGRLARSVLGSHLTSARLDLQTLSQAESVRLADVRFIVDELSRLNTETDSPFAGHLDIASIAIAGHSLGGLTALEAAKQDPRIRAIVAIDGVMPGKSFGPMATPTLVLDAGQERWSPDKQQLWGKLRGQRFALNLPGAEHVVPSDLVWLAKSAIKTGGMTREQTVAAMREIVAAFLDASLQGKPVDRLLMQRSARFPAVEVIEASQ